MYINFNRRYGGLDGGRFCFEGGSRCGKGEGIHVLRLDEPIDLQKAFDNAAQGKLEAKRPKSGFFKPGQSNASLSLVNSGSHSKPGSKYPYNISDGYSNNSAHLIYIFYPQFVQSYF